MRMKAYNTTSRIATAPPLPIITAAAAGAASPALVCAFDRGFGYVGNLGYTTYRQIYPTYSEYEGHLHC